MVPFQCLQHQQGLYDASVPELQNPGMVPVSQCARLLKSVALASQLLLFGPNGLVCRSLGYASPLHPRRHARRLGQLACPMCHGLHGNRFLLKRILLLTLADVMMQQSLSSLTSFAAASHPYLKTFVAMMGIAALQCPQLQAWTKVPHFLIQ